MGQVKPQRASIDLGAQADFACGSFDLKASFRSLFDRNVAEEWLGGALKSVAADLVQSPLVLACYASPTVCDAIKHYRASANSMLGMELDSCRALEGGLDDVQRRTQARSVKECLEAKARAGVPLDQAQKDCRRGSGGMRGLGGTSVQSIDVTADLGLSGDLTGGLKIGAGTLQAESRATAVVEAYEARRVRALRAWEAALRNPEGASGGELGPVSRRDVERIGAMEPGRQADVVRSVAAAQALRGLLQAVHETERSLESAELLAAPEVREELTRRRALLRNEMSRLVEAFEMERRLNGAVSEAQAAAQSDEAARVREGLGPRRALEAGERAAERLRPWGCEVKAKKGDGHDEKR